MIFYKKWKGVLSQITPIKESVTGGGVARIGVWKFYKRDKFFIAESEKFVKKFKSFDELDMWVSENIKIKERV